MWSLEESAHLLYLARGLCGDLLLTTVGVASPRRSIAASLESRPSIYLFQTARLIPICRSTALLLIETIFARTVGNVESVIVFANTIDANLDVVVEADSL
jgi:hypothetical protein